MILFDKMSLILLVAFVILRCCDVQDRVAQEQSNAIPRLKDSAS